jgi:site-specific DNA-methyltransferase (adenine-specific)
MKEMYKINDDITLYNDDCMNVLKDFKKGSIDLVVTDAPYDIAITGGGGTVNTLLKLDESLKDLTKTQDITCGYNIEALAELVNFIQDGNINAYFWCNKKQIPDYFDVYVNKLDCKFEILCWHKNNALPTYSNKYLSDTEYCLYFHKGIGRTFPESYNDAFTYWIEPINNKDKILYGHPTIKPIKMIDKLIRNSSEKGDVVLDCFLGSGRTAVSCHRLGRKCIGVEINEDYYNIAKKRIKEETSKLTLF